MKQIFLFSLIVLLLVSCNKDKNEKSDQPTFYTFSGQIGTNDNSTLVSEDNNIVICGNSGSNILILKISKAGTQIWRNEINAGNMSSASSIAETKSRELFICGETFRNYNKSMKDILIVKTNSSGDTIWTKTYGGIESEYGSNIITTSDGNLLILGKTESFGAGTFGDIYLIKIDTNGDTLWTKSYPDQDQEVPFHLIETKNGEFLVTGINEDGYDSRDLYLLKVSSDGVQLWNKNIEIAMGYIPNTWGYSTIELSNTELLICGENHGQVLLVKTDNYGTMDWKKEFGDPNLSEKGVSIVPNSDGTYTITGSSYDINTMQDDIIILKVDQNGNQVWFKKFGSSKSDWGMNLIKDTNDDNIITGNYYEQIFMTKLDNAGNYK